MENFQMVNFIAVKISPSPLHFLSSILCNYLSTWLSHSGSSSKALWVAFSRVFWKPNWILSVGYFHVLKQNSVAVWDMTLPFACDKGTVLLWYVSRHVRKLVGSCWRWGKANYTCGLSASEIQFLRYLLLHLFFKMLISFKSYQVKRNREMV